VTKVRKGTAVVSALAILLSACASEDPASEPSAGGPALADCPATAPPRGGAPKGAAPAQASEIVVPVDTSTSTVVDPGTEPQIQCGRTELALHEDVVYATRTLADGSSRDLLMDIQAPKTGDARPLVVYVPGGGFVSAAKEQALNVRTFVTEAGYVAASIQYRTATDGAVYTDGIADAKSAIRFLRANAEDYGIDPDRVAVWGQSAGGYLASMVGVTGDRTDLDVGENLDQSSAVQAVIDQFGASDLAKLFADYGPAAEQGFANSVSPISQYVTGPGGPSLAASPDAVAQADPVTHIAADDPPFVLFHGDNDLLISPSQTLLLHNALVAASVDSTRYVVHGAGHGDLTFAGDPEAGLPWSTAKVMGLMVDFLDGHLT
jgi:acetyl esterase/lipase